MDTSKTENVAIYFHVANDKDRRTKLTYQDMTGTPFVPAMVAIIIVIRIKKLINRFKDSGTTSIRAARSTEELNVRRSFIFRRLVKRNVLVEAVPGKFYLKEENLEGYYRDRRIRILVVVIILVLLVAADILFFRL